MSATSIRVKHLGKKYPIVHRNAPRHTTLRDALSHSAKRWMSFKRAAHSEVEEFWALTDLSLEIRQGDIVGIIGRNGAGKSTLLKLLSRITDPTTGVIEFTGRIASLLEVGTGFHPELSGRDNIFLNGAILGMRRAEIQKKFDSIVEFSGVERFLDTPVKHYSSGMYMRLAFAVAAHLETDILLVDEVLAVGDAEFQKKCLGKMQEVAHESGRTVVFVSHNMQAIKALCNRTAHLDRGRLLSYGPTNEVLSSYLVQGSSSSGKWVCEDQTASAHADFQLLSIEVEDSQGSAGAYFSSQDLTVTTVFKLAKPIPALCVGFDLVTGEGFTVFRSYQTDQAEQQWLPQKPGVHTWACEIPAGLLNAGVYYVSPRISIHNVKWITTLDAVLEFEIVLSHGVSPFWNSLSGKSRPGCVAPLLQWSATEAGAGGGTPGFSRSGC
jgi:lipopolysaccharide transport system ATP-binding protein